MYFLHVQYISYKKKKKNSNSEVKARAQVFGLPYCGFLIFVDRGQNSDHPWCVSWSGYKRPCCDSGDALWLDQVLVTHVHTQVELHQSVHLRFANLTMCEPYLNEKKQISKYDI